MEEVILSQNKPMLDLSLINSMFPLKFYKANGKIGQGRGLNCRFVRKKNIPDLRGLIIHGLIYENFDNIKDFSKAIKKSKAWVWSLIHDFDDIKIKQDTHERICQALGVEIKF
jgi:hypothetical protein